MGLACLAVIDVTMNSLAVSSLESELMLAALLVCGVALFTLTLVAYREPRLKPLAEGLHKPRRRYRSRNSHTTRVATTLV